LAGVKALHDYELLELYLFNSIPRRDVKPIAKRLIERFGSFSEVITAPIAHLVSVDGVGHKTAVDLKVVQAAALKLGEENLLGRDVLSSWTALMDYCRATLQYEDREQFRVLFLDKKNRLISDEVLAQGTVDRAPVYPREVIKKVLELESSAMILVHNHPSGDPTPSQSDIDMTRTLITATQAINVVIHDHVIVGRNDIVSLKTLGLM